jgi:hypothetical protein
MIRDKRKFIAYPNPNGFRDGMTLEDYFASQAMLGLIALRGIGNDGGARLAKSAYQVAGAMLDERGGE